MLLLCTHLGEPLGTKEDPAGIQVVHRCRDKRHPETTLCGCLRCPDYLCPSAAQPVATVIAGKPETACQHPGHAVVNRFEQPAGVADLFRGSGGFLVLSGPSAKTMPLESLNQRGILIMSANNSPAILPPPMRPHVWLHTDPAKKFHDSLWRDPGILKFTPVREWNVGRKNKKALRRRMPDGTIEPYDNLGARDRPAVLGFERNSEFVPARWLHEPSFNRGNDEQHAKGTKGAKPNGFPHVINTMFCCLRLAFYLGINPLYLIGVDFHMDPDTPYAFKQGKSAGGVRANNHAFSKMDRMFRELQPHFDAAGFRVYNCTPGSALWAFPRLDFAAAVAEATAGFERELNCDGWYDQNE